jgi:alkylated DNA repair dioxygenase AlkB
MAAQSALFDAPAELPNGLVLVPDFLSVEEEHALLAEMRALDLEEARYKAYTARRRVASFGASYDFDANEVRPAPGLPPFLEPLRARVSAWLGIPAGRFVQAMVSEYRPGTPLGWHRDVPQYEVIVGISLGTEARMGFRPYPPRPHDRLYALELAPRSAYVLQGEVRWRWQHRIEATKALRYSITFRTAVEGARHP